MTSKLARAPHMDYALYAHRGSRASRAQHTVSGALYGQDLITRIPVYRSTS